MLLLEHATQDLQQNNVIFAKLRKLRSIAVGGAETKSSIASVIASFEDENWHVKQAALKALRRIAKRGDQFVVDSVCAQLEHQDWRGRWIALKALVDIAPKNNARIFLAVISCFEDAMCDVRHLAIEVLGDVVSRGHKPAVAAVTERLRHNGCHVRKAAVEALAQIVQREDKGSIVAASELLQDMHLEVRLAVLHMLGKLGRGDRCATAAVCSFLTHEEKQIRQTGIRALLIVAEKGDPRVVSALSSLLADEDMYVRWDAVRALGQVTEKGDKHAISVVCENFLRNDWHLFSREVIKALHQIADVGDERVIKHVAAYLESPDEHVRQAAVDVLVAMAKKEDACAIHHLSMRHTDTSPLVRKAVVQAFSKVSEMSNPTTLRIVQSALVDPDIYVRWAAVRTLGEVADETDAVGVLSAALGEALEREDPPDAAQDVLRALRQVGPAGHTHAIDALSSQLTNHKGQVRLAALQMLSNFSTCDERRSLVAVRALLKDSHQDIRQLAFKLVAAKFDNEEADTSKHRREFPRMGRRDRRSLSGSPRAVQRPWMPTRTRHGSLVRKEEFNHVVAGLEFARGITPG
mmetsp:Transcript_76446/g.132654  ORF Transcript_76446/g.132654 Transcript_76446/m.132654 type:complete len:578 (-) Transcript_76446:111-1844(-)